MRPSVRALGTALGVLLLAAVGLLGLPSGVDAQGANEETSLERVEELTRLGRTEEARSLLIRWWSEGRDEASRRDRQRALWIRGRLTVDPAQAELDFQRLVLEFPGGDFSDQALLRLAQAAWAEGDGEAMEVWMGRLTRDYPGSPVVPEARRWREGAGPLPEASGAAPTTETAEGTGQVGEESAPGYAIQLGAFAGAGRARTLRSRVRDAGYDVRLIRVRGSRLLHVRVGRFASEADARTLLEEIRSLGMDATLVDDVQREREP